MHWPVVNRQRAIFIEHLSKASKTDAPAQFTRPFAKGASSRTQRAAMISHSLQLSPNI